MTDKEKIMAEEPVSEDLKEAAKAYCGDGPEWQPDRWLYIAGAEWQKKQMINKACEWLEENLPKEIGVIYSDMVHINFRDAVDKFRKAMAEDK